MATVFFFSSMDAVSPYQLVAPILELSIVVFYFWKLKICHFWPKMALFAYQSLPYIWHTWFFWHQCALWVRMGIFKQINGTKMAFNHFQKIKNRHLRPKMALVAFPVLPYIRHTWVSCINVPFGFVWAHTSKKSGPKWPLCIFWKLKMARFAFRSFP